ncbi:sorting nexin-29 isoform X1 [Daphnia magna]|uniref:sorting nexin-29 isoform X1 n=1 Tax=Daphnia magna TaxID=35525 RepID=UPI0014039606|nr:sorting nexin-29 isoform X1 [Daphnia magna]
MCESGSMQYRDELIKIIRENVQNCEKKFGGKTLLATEAEQSVIRVINGFELILQDGLKVKNGVNLKSINLNVNSFSLRHVTELVSNGINMVMNPIGQSDQNLPVFWHFVRNHLTRHEQERYYHIQNITTDYGRGRAWLRSAINEHSLDRYLRMLFSDENLISNYYEPSALMNDTCSRECLLTSAKDLRSVIFALVVDRKELDLVDESKKLMIQSLRPEPQAVKMAITEQEQVKPKKKSKVRVVDLESDGEVEKPAKSFNTAAITIPQSGSTPSLIFQHTGSSPSIKSIDSHDAQLTESKRSTMNLSEMKQMLLDLTEKKIQLEDSKSSLQLQLHGVQLEKQDIQDRLKTAEQQNMELLRENTILKEQLKHYMGAVQMLKNSTSNAVITPTSLSVPPDYHQEANHFEEKLIQVAEMHGELMEFNSHLQCSLKAAERFADRLRTELVHLRGPLPSDYAACNDENTRICNLASSTESPWIHIWIPSTFLVQGAVDSHHVYQVYIRIGDTEWTIFKRYSQMYKFRKEMLKRYPFTAEIHFPPKKKFGYREEKTVEDRRRKLQEFLRRFLNLWMRNETFMTSLNQTTFVGLFSFFSEQPNPTPQLT